MVEATMDSANSKMKSMSMVYNSEMSGTYDPDNINQEV